MNLFKPTIFTLFIATVTPLHSQDVPEEFVQSIGRQSLMQTTGFLSSIRFKGRLQGTPEYEEAARYVATRFNRLGLKPVGQESLLHFFPVETNIIERAFVALSGSMGSADLPLILGKDYNCRGFSGSAKVNAPIAFVGYGLVHDELNDYGSLQVRGHIVMVYKGEPNWRPSQGTWGDTSPREKARIAAERGALAVVFLPNPREASNRELIGSYACGDGPHLDSIPMIQITRAVADTIFQVSQTSYRAVTDSISSKKGSHSFHIPQRMSVYVYADYRANVQTPNVVALWEGSHRRLKKQFIVLGAHLDHVGMQGNAVLYPGANDNASGVAALIEIARALKNEKIKTERSILFVVFSAEESGMHGSQHFVAHAPINIKKIAAMVNFDCVAQGDSIAVGGKWSFPKTWKIAARNDAKFTHLLSSKTFGGGGSDAEAFYRAGIPTLYFHTSNGYQHLHLESDKPETLNPELFESLTKLGFLTTVDLAKKGYKKEKEKKKK